MGSAETFPAFMLSRRSESSAIPRAPSPEKNTFKLHLPPTWTTSAQHSTCPFVLPCSQGDISPVPHASQPTAHSFPLPSMCSMSPCSNTTDTAMPLAVLHVQPRFVTQGPVTLHTHRTGTAFSMTVPAGVGALHVSLYRDPLSQACTWP